MTPAIPRIIGPNFGCPHLVSPATLVESGVEIVLALPVSEDPPTVDYRVEASGQGLSFDLFLSDPIPVDDDQLPVALDTVEQTRRQISTCLRHGVFAGQARFWVFRAKAKKEPPVQRRINLFDLRLSRGDTPLHIVLHALCLRQPAGDVRFVHLTDLHVAARNDIWANEVNRSINASAGGRIDFLNFNDHVRKFVLWANAEADAGRLDLVVALGDLVDFVFHGLTEAEPGDNNWTTLFQILSSLRVPIFTTLGNHDWRPYPYNPTFNPWIFGLEKKDAAKFDYFYYDSSDLVAKRVLALNDKLIAEGSPILAQTWWHSAVSNFVRWVEIAMERGTTRVLSFAGKYLKQALAIAFAVGQTTGLWIFGRDTIWIGIVLLLMVMVLTPMLRQWIGSRLREKIEMLFSIETGAAHLRDYFLNFCPYFNYAVRVENCYFLVLDTGYDVFTGQSFWDDGAKKLGPVSVRDNIIAGSPDTMGFFPPNEHYHYSQIAWIEQVLDCIRLSHGGQTVDSPRQCRVFACVHTPPANLSPKQKDRAESQPAPVFMKRALIGGYDIRFGTINHYLSEFYYLCLGYQQCELTRPTGPGVDAVFAGHAHWSIEFKIEKGAAGAGDWDPIVWFGRFSPQVEAGAGAPNEYWGPLLLQTGACGPRSEMNPHPPNFRYVTVEPDLRVTTLAPRHL